MYSDNDLLDAPTRDPHAKMPPAIVSFEKYFFPIIFVIQYLCLLQMATARGFEALIGIMIGGSLLFITGVWQVVVGLIRYLGDTKHKGWRLYMILAAVNLGVLFLTFFADFVRLYYGFGQLVGLAFLFVVPHGISWYYWYLAMRDSQLRQKMLYGQI
jgi:uncharacterized membrane protein